MKLVLQKRWLGVISTALIFFNYSLTWALDDDTPFFAGNSGAPNVMIILDNSDSMQDSPYLRDNGGPYTIPNQRWKRGVKIDANGVILDNTPGVAGGTVTNDDTKYVLPSGSALTLPISRTPHLPGISSSSSSVTTIPNTPCADPSLRCTDRIYDSNINWNLLVSTMDNTYRYRKVVITDTTVASTQTVNLDGYSASEGYWTVFGGSSAIEYDPAHSYNYDLVPGEPGEVTYNAGTVALNRVYDRNFNWGLLTTSLWSSEYSGRVLEVYEGANALPVKNLTLTGYNATDGYWTVSGDFDLPCDYTTKYRILMSATDITNAGNKNASGGNHPDSKLYQAKLALKQFLETPALKGCKTTDATGKCIESKYLANFGFASYIQAAVPQTRARYYRWRAEVPGVDPPPFFRYWYYRNESTSSTIETTQMCTGTQTAPVPPATVTFTWNGANHSGGIGTEFNRTGYRPNGACSDQTIRYRVVKIDCIAKDSSPGLARAWVESNKDWTTSPKGVGPAPTYTPQWGYTRYTNVDVATPAGTTTCPAAPYPAAPAPPAGGWTLTTTCNASTCIDQGPTTAAQAYYEVTEQTTVGDLRVIDPTAPKYIKTAKSVPPLTDADSYTVTPYKGYCRNAGTNSWDYCENPDPDTIPSSYGDTRWGDWKLLETPLVNVSTNTSGAIGTLYPLIYDNTYYRIPGKSDQPTYEPHGWSYKQTIKRTTATKADGSPLDNNHIYVTGTSYTSKWGEADQKNPYFPSLPGNPKDRFSNFSGDDQSAFIDLPRTKSTEDNKGDDIYGYNMINIKSLIDLARIPRPSDSNAVSTMAPESMNSMPVSTSFAKSPEGTPLGATLEDARKYFEDYIKQDPFSQGGCRSNYIILLTDGLESANGDAVTAAKALQNLTYNGQSTPVKVYVIGFGLDNASKANLNAIATAGGSATRADGNSAFFANNVAELVKILADDIASDFLGGSFTRSKASITNASESDDGLSLYLGYFDYPVWKGHLEAYDLDREDGSVTGKALHWATNCSSGKADAGCIMAEDHPDGGNAPDGPVIRRTLFTSVEKTGPSGPVLTRTPFSPDKVAELKSLLLPPNPANPSYSDINGNGTPDEDEDAKDVINYVHHPGYEFDIATGKYKYKGTRDGEWPLADIYNSGPIIVSAPRTGGCVATPTGLKWDSMPGYCAFMYSKKNRETVVYVGTNGGMVQSFAAGQQALPAVKDSNGNIIKPAVSAVNGGYEKWGYIPNSVLGNLHGLKDGHKFSMDLPLTVGEVDTDEFSNTTGWKTILVAGQRKGGNAYFALDVTDPDDPQPLWEFKHPGLGQTWSIPSLGRIEINGVGTSVVFLGGGYSSGVNVGNRVYIVRAADGLLLKELVVGSTTNDVPGGLRTIRYGTDKTGKVVDYRTNLAELPDGTLVNYTNRKDFIETAYFGDTSGTLWRLDNLNNSQTKTTADPYGPPWSDDIAVTALYTPPSDKQAPIFYRPAVYDIKNGSIDNGVVKGCVKRYISVGTGDETSPTAAKDASGKPIVNYAFEIEDREWNADDAARTPAWTAAEKNSGLFRLNWRINLGFMLPQDQYGFLLAPPNGTSRVKKGGKDILDANIYILPLSEYQSGGYGVDANGHLTKDGDVVVLKGRFLIRHDTAVGSKNDNGLYTNAAGSQLVANDGTYLTRNISLWISDENGCFYDIDGSCLVDTNQYVVDNNGYLSSGLKVITDAGEKILSELRNSGGNVFFTSYTPEGGCGVGVSYLYGLQGSSCIELAGIGVLEYDSLGKKIVPIAQGRLRLGVSITGGVEIGGGKAYIAVSSLNKEDSNDKEGVELEEFNIPTVKPQLLYWRQD